MIGRDKWSSNCPDGTTITAYEQTDLCLDGTPVTVRSVRPTDHSNLQSIMQHLSKESRYFRFLTQKSALTEKELNYFSSVDNTHVALIVLVAEANGEVAVGIGHYFVDADDADTAEVALTVEDDYQGKGIGTILLQHLEQIARGNGIRKFFFLVHPNNTKMLEVLKHCKLPVIKETDTVSGTEITLGLNCDSAALR